LSQFKKYRPSGNLTFNYLGIFQSLKLRILVGKIRSISLLNFTPNTSGCYGLNIKKRGKKLVSSLREKFYFSHTEFKNLI